MPLWISSTVFAVLLAIEEVLFSEPVDEIMLDVPPHRLSSWLHQDLEHRLVHFEMPVTAIRHGQ